VVAQPLELGKRSLSVQVRDRCGSGIGLGSDNERGRRKKIGDLETRMRVSCIRIKKIK